MPGVLLPCAIHPFLPSDKNLVEADMLSEQDVKAGIDMIGILTFYWADDYGAMLQAYALKRYIETTGKEAEMIPYAPLRLSGRYCFLPVTAAVRNKRLKYDFNCWIFLRNLSVGTAFYMRRKRMREFRRSYLTKEPPVKRAEKISLQKYSCVFVGSDQVWNPEITVGLDDAYLGRIKDKEGCRLVAYGASFGGARLPEKECTELAEAIQKNFSEISLREKGAADFMSRILHRNTADVLDPTLLLDREEWEKLGREPEEKNYILLCDTEENRQMTDYACGMAQAFHKKVLQVSMPVSLKPKPGVRLRVSGGPAEFIGYVRNAWCVVTNSFHGTVFSILMEKQFLVFAHRSRNERMESILKKLDLEARLVNEGERAGSRKMWSMIDWKKTKEYLERERAVSQKFINGNMERL